jgi:hypothetical protein
MVASKIKNLDALTTEIKRRLKLGKYIRYLEMSDFIVDLEQEEIKLGKLAKARNPQVISVYEFFLSECYNKIEECDDSGANLSTFFRGLFCGWIRARQLQKLPAEETIKQILQWMERDQYGFCCRIETDLAKVLNQEGRRLLIAHFQALIDQSPIETIKNHHKTIFDYPTQIRHSVYSLKEIHLAQKSLKAYQTLCERIGFSPLDCQHLAAMEISRRNWASALRWAEKGLAIEKVRGWHNEHGDELASMRSKAELQVRLPSSLS